MGLDAWLTIAATLVMVAAMTRGMDPDFVLLGGLTFLVAVGVLPIGDAVAGFANDGMLTVAAMLIVSTGVRDTGGLDLLLRRVLGHPRSLAIGQLRMMTPVSFVSAFLNNTPVVAMMVPVVNDWSRRSGLPLSRLLIPLSYASILGGTCTLIGTSTNLVVYGLLKEHSPNADVGMFDIAVLGVPTLIVGIAYVVLASPRLLPQRDSTSDLLERGREYSVVMSVEAGSPIVGQSIEAAGLRHLPGLYLVEIERDGELMPAVGPRMRLHAGDRLLFVGVVGSVADLRKVNGLVPAVDAVHKLRGPRPDRRLLEAVVAASSGLTHKSVRESRFRTRFDAAIIAVHRQGARVSGKVGDIVLAPGDVLLLEAAPSFLQRYQHDSAFALISEVEGSETPRHERAWVALTILVVMVTVNALGLLPLLTAGMLASGAMLLTGCLKVRSARNAIDLRVLLAIAAAFGVGEALEQSGAANYFAENLVLFAAPYGTLALLAAIYLATAFLTELITNSAAAALMFPLVASICDRSDLPLVPAALVTMMAASASFSTPIGYQTNLMVYGPGGYRFGDFLRFGIPLQILAAVVCIAIANWLWL